MNSKNHPDKAEPGRRFRPDIEGLRAIAIVAVLLCHAGVPFLAGGYVGVDVFFVISGFLITRLLVGELDRSGTISLRGYFAQGLEPSPVLHLWSLAIEEQFYLVWPGLILLTTWIFRRRGHSVRPVLWVVLAIILAGSLIYGIFLTEDKPAFAYFDTFARAWELGLGAALALIGTNVRLPRLGAVALGWAGVAAIVYASFAFTGETAFPGTA